MPRDDSECTYCGRRFTHNGLCKHLRACKVKHHNALRTVLREDVDLSNTRATRVAGLLPMDDTDDEHMSDIPEELLNTTFDDGSSDEHCISNNLSGAIDSTTIHRSRGRFLADSHTSQISYYDLTRRPAGQPMAGIDQKIFSNDPPSTTPFNSTLDQAFAKWLLMRDLTQGDIQAFFQDEDLRPMREKLGFQGASEWKDLVERIPDTITDDQFFRKTLTLESDLGGTSRYTLYYRDITNALRFLLGHHPFIDDLSYSPIRMFNSSNSKRVYNELHTGDWWWNTQDRLPTGATVVPLLLASDKTQLTQHRGSKSSWPVYLTIGNLNGGARRKQHRPGTVLLGLIPICEEEGQKSKIYHEAMRHILRPIEESGRTGVPIVCADGWTRACYPIIAGFTVDYEEQVLITGVKKNRHCTICRVPPDKREDLQSQMWPLRTHAYTQSQIRKIRRYNIPQAHDDWVHDTDNFAWYHPHVNIHQGMMIDILHQLAKGITMDIIKWLERLLKEWESKQPRRQRNADGLSSRISTQDQLDDRFRSIPPFAGLPHFGRFSQIKQWTGNEARAILRQIIPVYTPILLQTGHHDALRCVRAFVDFALLAQYHTHNDETLRYLQQALDRFCTFKEVFRGVRSGTNLGKGHFNYPKFHILVHWAQFIRLFGTAVDLDSQHSEHCHSYMIKTQYKKTNKRDGYETQMLAHVLRLLKMTTYEDIKLFYESRRTLPVDQASQNQVSRVTYAIKLTSNHRLQLTTRERTQVLAMAHAPTKEAKRYWRTISYVANKLNLPDLIDAVAVYVRQMRRKNYSLSTGTETAEYSRPDFVGVEQYLIKIHGSIKYYQRDGRDRTGTGRLEPQYARCQPWQHNRRRSEWRKDFVWVQHYAVGDHGRTGAGLALGSERVGQIQLIFTIEDAASQQDSGKFPRYTGALIELLCPRNGGKADRLHGMIEVEKWSNPGKRSCQVYEIQNILRCAHLVPAQLEHNGTWFINNYVDWDEYNAIFDPDFEAHAVEDMQTFKNKQQP